MTAQTKQLFHVTIVAFQQALGHPAIAVAAPERLEEEVSDFDAAVQAVVTEALAEIQTLPAGDLPPPQRDRDYTQVVDVGSASIEPDGTVHDVHPDASAVGTVDAVHLFIGKSGNDTRKLFAPQSPADDGDAGE